MASAQIAKKVLIVEDNADTRDMMDIYVKKIGYTPILAQDGKNAIETAIQYLPDIILMDVAMPTINGVEAATILRSTRRTANIPIVAVTAHGQAIPGEVTNELFNEIVQKPFDLKILEPLIKKHVRNQD